MENQQLEDLKIHAQAMAGDGEHSPLLQIREKELEIRGRLMEAQKEAEQIVADARAKSATTIEEATRRADKEASEAYAAGVAKIDEEATELKKEHEKETAAAIKESRGRLDAAVERIFGAVMP